MHTWIKTNMYLKPSSNQALAVFSNVAPWEIEKNTELCFYLFIFFEPEKNLLTGTIHYPKSRIIIRFQELLY